MTPSPPSTLSVWHNNISIIYTGQNIQYTVQYIVNMDITIVENVSSL